MILFRNVAKAARNGLRTLGVDVTPASVSSDSYLLNRLHPLRDHLLGIDSDIRPFLRFCEPRIEISRSQIMQDLFVLWVTGEKRDGFFVDFGATDGVNLSNSYLLESRSAGHGIAAEPARGFHEKLKANRSCNIETECVSDRTGDVLMFNETPGLGLSTLDSFSDSDRHADLRADGNRYNVRTISLNDLLARYKAPREIDYLSIDTEGSELSILSSFDLVGYKPRIVTVEHNFVDEKRGAIFNIMAAAGYRRRFEQISLFDDWYVQEG